jgi:hypothetical protein
MESLFWDDPRLVGGGVIGTVRDAAHERFTVALLWSVKSRIRQWRPLSFSAHRLVSSGDARPFVSSLL